MTGVCPFRWKQNKKNWGFGLLFLFVCFYSIGLHSYTGQLFNPQQLLAHWMFSHDVPLPSYHLPQISRSFLSYSSCLGLLLLLL